MPRYLVAIYRPHDYDPSTEDEAMAREISALNAAMVAAGARVFVGGLQAPGTALTLRRQADGDVRVSEGLHCPGAEHVGGFWVLEVASRDEALAWGRKASAACRASVELRPFHPPGAETKPT